MEFVVDYRLIPKKDGGDGKTIRIYTYNTDTHASRTLEKKIDDLFSNPEILKKFDMTPKKWALHSKWIDNKEIGGLLEMYMHEFPNIDFDVQNGDVGSIIIAKDIKKELRKLSEFDHHKDRDHFLKYRLKGEKGELLIERKLEFALEEINLNPNNESAPKISRNIHVKNPEVALYGSVTAADLKLKNSFFKDVGDDLAFEHAEKKVLNELSISDLMQYRVPYFSSVDILDLDEDVPRYFKMPSLDELLACNVAAKDIETDHKVDDSIVSTVFHSDKTMVYPTILDPKLKKIGESKVIVFENEQSLLQGLEDIEVDDDALFDIGFNNFGFDLRILNNRKKGGYNGGVNRSPYKIEAARKRPTKSGEPYYNLIKATVGGRQGIDIFQYVKREISLFVDNTLETHAKAIGLDFLKSKSHDELSIAIKKSRDGDVKSAREIAEYTAGEKGDGWVTHSIGRFYLKNILLKSLMLEKRATDVSASNPLEMINQIRRKDFYRARNEQIRKDYLTVNNLDEIALTLLPVYQNSGHTNNFINQYNYVSAVYLTPFLRSFFQVLRDTRSRDVFKAYEDEKHPLLKYDLAKFLHNYLVEPVNDCNAMLKVNNRELGVTGLEGLLGRTDSLNQNLMESRLKSVEENILDKEIYVKLEKTGKLIGKEKELNNRDMRFGFAYNQKRTRIIQKQEIFSNHIRHYNLTNQVFRELNVLLDRAGLITIKNNIAFVKDSEVAKKMEWTGLGVTLDYGDLYFEHHNSNERMILFCENLGSDLVFGVGKKSYHKIKDKYEQVQINLF